MIVVAAAILRSREGAAPGERVGEVLVGQRGHPPELAGRWEFPGGKVDDGETDPDALIRECAEELGVGIRVGARLAGDVPVMGGGGVLRVFTAELTRGVPVAREHLALRWISAEEVAALDWLVSNRPLLAPLARLLGVPAGHNG